MPDKQESKSIPVYGNIDERTKAIAYKGDAFAGRFLMFAVMLYCFYDFFCYNKVPWELLALLFIAATISTIYQIKNKIIVEYRSIIIFTSLIFFISVLVAVLSAFVLHWFKHA